MSQSLTKVESLEELEAILQAIYPKTLGKNELDHGWYYYFPSENLKLYTTGDFKCSLFKKHLKNYNIHSFDSKGIFLIGNFSPFKNDTNIKISDIIKKIISKNEENCISEIPLRMPDILLYKGREISDLLFNENGLILFIYQGIEEINNSNLDFIKSLINKLEENFILK